MGKCVTNILCCIINGYMWKFSEEISEQTESAYKYGWKYEEVIEILENISTEIKRAQDGLTVIADEPISTVKES